MKAKNSPRKRRYRIGPNWFIATVVVDAQAGDVKHPNSETQLLRLIDSAAMTYHDAAAMKGQMTALRCVQMTPAVSLFSPCM